MEYLLAPLVCAFIGWMTNYLAIRMLFHPRQPRRVLLWTWQGLLPKRQKELAEKLGQMVEEELISHEDIWAAVNDPDFHRRLRNLVDINVERFIHQKLTRIHPMLPPLLKGKVMARLKELIVDEVEKFIPETIERAAAELEDRLEFRRLVQEKIENFSMPKLEEVVFSILRTELRFVEIMGGVLGLVVGTAQSIVLSML